MLFSGRTSHRASQTMSSPSSDAEFVERVAEIKPHAMKMAARVPRAYRFRAGFDFSTQRPKVGLLVVYEPTDLLVNWAF